MASMVKRYALSVGLLASVFARSPAAPPIETLKPVGGLSASLVATFREPVAFVELTSGGYLVLDRRAHVVYRIEANGSTARRLIDIGVAAGQVLSPSALALGAGDVVGVLDAPTASPRVQYFTGTGTRIGTFYLSAPVAPRLVIEGITLNSGSMLQVLRETFLVSLPEVGGLLSELDNHGWTVRLFGTLRRTGEEADRDLHLALNLGLPLVDPTGGFYFVFQTGVPMFRKYDNAGHLLFERHIEGPELDAEIGRLPTEWPKRTAASGIKPYVPPLVRTAAVDRAGRLWVSLTSPFTYVFDSRGEKIRTVQFQAEDTIRPTSFFFASRDRVLVTPGCYEFSSR
jgi:hypothetical protein